MRPQVRWHALVWGLVLSRFGLSSFDLAANQLIQESNNVAALGTVNGVQGALQSLFQMLANLAGVEMPATEDFMYLMLGSVCIVVMAASLFIWFAMATGCGRRPVAPPLQVVQVLDAAA